ncbi:MAG: hypothetical protein AMXMBFR33_32730 [Candidatus Xenobia bacterium]
MAAPPEPTRSVESVSSKRTESTAPAPSTAPSAASARATGGSTQSRASSEPSIARDGFESPSLSEEGDELPWLSALTGGLTDASKKKPPYDEVWKSHREPFNDPATVKNRAELEGRLTGKSEHTKGLLDLLERDQLSDPRHLSYIDKIRSRLGPEKAEQALGRLRDFYQKQGNAEPNQQLMKDILHDLAIPSDINQKDKGTCTMTSVQMKWAIEDPDSYVRCLTELHTKGSTRMPDGSTLERNDSHKKGTDDQRSLTVKYLSDSLMGSCTSLLSGHWGGYDSTDKDADGRTSGEVLQALNRVFPNQGYTNDTTVGSNRSTLIQYMEDDLARGRTVTASVPGHKILVVGLDKSGADPQVILNTWGEQKKMSLSDFQKYIRAVETVDDSGWDSRKTPAGQLTQHGDR